MDDFYEQEEWKEPSPYLQHAILTYIFWKIRLAELVRKAGRPFGFNLRRGNN